VGLHFLDKAYLVKPKCISEELVILVCVVLSQYHRMTATDRWTDMPTIRLSNASLALAYAKLSCFYGPQCRSLIYFVSALGLLSFIRVAESIKA